MKIEYPGFFATRHIMDTEIGMVNIKDLAVGSVRQKAWRFLDEIDEMVNKNRTYFAVRWDMRQANKEENEQ